jgi:hypothetical protein
MEGSLVHIHVGEEWEFFIFLRSHCSSSSQRREVNFWPNAEIYKKKYSCSVWILFFCCSFLVYKKKTGIIE